MKALGNDWDEIMKDEIAKPYYIELKQFLKREYTHARVFPPMDEVYSALKTTAFCDVKVVILGQDPYIKEGEAHGMAFSVNHGISIPPSLKNVYKELVTDMQKDLEERGKGYVFEIPNHGHLMNWSKQGVLLLNTVLTVRAGKSKSHANYGWEKMTTFLISELNKKTTPIVFMLWGNDAKAKSELINNAQHLVLKTAHPSPLAGGAFFGCRHFSKANSYFRQRGLSEIDWRL
ncbi:MAG: uracil-DNA glycosylase [Clostridiales bacterium]|jgi:uracil-DNA glycosylase|nr:uracil-DNA glycosylase [Clostridiales bacterium]